MQFNVILVEGMTCEHCAQTIKKALNELIGMKSIEVDLKNKMVTVDFDKDLVNVESIKENILEAGFEVRC